MPSSRPKRVLRNTILLLAGVLVSVVCGLLAFGSFRHDPDGWRYHATITREAFVGALDQVSWISAALLVVITMASLPLRAIQWGELVSPSGTFRDRYHSTAVGFMAVNTLPLSLGEVTRGLLLAYRVPSLMKSTSVGSVLCGRMFDIFALWVLAAPLPFVLQVAPASRPFLNGGIAALTALAWGAMLLLWVAQRQRENVTRLLGKLLGPRIGEVLGRFLEGFGVRLSGGAFFRAMAWTIVFQAVTAAAYIPIIHAIAPQVPPITAAIYGLAAISVSLAVPSTPSGVGVFHLAMGAAMESAGATTPQAAAIGILLHLGAFSGFVLAGVLSLAATGSGAFKASLSDSAT